MSNFPRETIDYPELAFKLFGREVPAGMQTPTRAGCDHSYGEPSFVESDCTEPGVMITVCSICGNVHKVPTPARGHIDEDEDRKCDICGTLLMGEYTLTDARGEYHHK